jgi:hypothetical protein
MITKEERAELREWAGDCNAWDLYLSSGQTGDQTVALLDALDAADERIAGLEAEVLELEGAEEQRATEEKRHEAEFYVCEKCGERKHKSNGGTDDEACDQCVEIRLLNARIAELEAAAQWRPMATAPRDGTEILVWCLGQHYELVAWEEHSCHQWIGDASRYDEDQVCAWLPIPALPEGGV